MSPPLPSPSTRRQSLGDTLLKQVLLCLLHFFTVSRPFLSFGFTVLLRVSRLESQELASLWKFVRFLSFIAPGIFYKVSGKRYHDVSMLNLTLVPWKYTLGATFSWVRGRRGYLFLVQLWQAACLPQITSIYWSQVWLLGILYGWIVCEFKSFCSDWRCTCLSATSLLHLWCCDLRELDLSKQPE